MVDQCWCPAPLFSLKLTATLWTHTNTVSRVGSNTRYMRMLWLEISSLQVDNPMKLCKCVWSSRCSRSATFRGLGHTNPMPRTNHNRDPLLHQVCQDKNVCRSLNIQNVKVGAVCPQLGWTHSQPDNKNTERWYRHCKMEERRLDAETEAILSLMPNNKISHEK